MATAFTAAFRLPRLVGGGSTSNSNSNNSSNTPHLLLSPETDIRISSPLTKKMRFRRRRSRTNKSEPPASAPLPALPSLPLPLTVKVKKPKTQPKNNSITLTWMETECPHDVLPKILSFCSPQTTAALHKSNRFWHTTISSEQTWRVLCEELYKWNEGDPEPEGSWRDFYAQNPTVPVDYPTVSKALEAICPNANKVVVDAEEYGASDSKPTRTIWLRAQEHRVSEPLLVQAIETNIAMETQQTTKRQRGRRRPLVSPQASLLLQTRRRNKPLVHVAAGHVTLKNLRLGHYCGGFNLWCGNSCVQVQPITPPETVAPLLPTANIESCEIVSHSGRGVVVNDGGNVTVSHSYIHDCAATGIYVGSHSCTLTLSHSDLISNGNGNRLAASVRATGVSRGHSGFYLENGNATLREVNISNNSSCGISVSSSESKLTLDHSDVVANGHSNQMEVTLGSQRLGAHNTVARTGLVKVRSKLALHKCFGGSGSDTATCRSRSSSSSSSARSQQNLPANRTRTDSDSSMEPLAATEEQNDGEDDLEHLQDSYVVAEENVRFGELIEI